MRSPPRTFGTVPLEVVPIWTTAWASCARATATLANKIPPGPDRRADYVSGSDTPAGAT